MTTFIFTPVDRGFSAIELEANLQGFFSKESLLGWLRHAIDNNVGIRDERGVAVAARLIKITVEMEEV